MDNEKFKAMCLQAIAKLEAQGVPSKKGGKCLYLASPGVCCIVGHMMPDDETRKAADRNINNGGTSVASLYEQGFEWVQQFDKEQLNLLTMLQHIHDESTTPIAFSFGIRNMLRLVEDLNDSRS
jgi:hypothetical protein